MKHTITFKLERDNAIIKHTIEEVGLTEVIEAFEDFLKGCGYQIDSNTLQIVDQEEEEDMVNDMATDEDVNRSGAV